MTGTKTNKNIPTNLDMLRIFERLVIANPPAPSDVGFVLSEHDRLRKAAVEEKLDDIRDLRESGKAKEQVDHALCELARII